MNLVHNERTKLIAAALNNVAVATIVTAFIAPIAGTLYGSTNVSGGLVDHQCHLAFGRCGTTYECTARPREASRMTDLQTYLLIAPIVLLAVGFCGALLWIKISDREHPRAR